LIDGGVQGFARDVARETELNGGALSSERVKEIAAGYGLKTQD
jgi:hypothetical protein